MSPVIGKTNMQRHPIRSNGGCATAGINDGQRGLHEPDGTLITSAGPNHTDKHGKTK